MTVFSNSQVPALLIGLLTFLFSKDLLNAPRLFCVYHAVKIRLLRLQLTNTAQMVNKGMAYSGYSTYRCDFLGPSKVFYMQTLVV